MKLLLLRSIVSAGFCGERYPTILFGFLRLTAFFRSLADHLLWHENNETLKKENMKY